MLGALSLSFRPGLVRTGRLSLTRLRAIGRSRQHLAQLDDRLLNDIGLTREDAAREAARRSWDAPRHWLK